MLEYLTHKGDNKSPNIILDPSGVMEFQEDPYQKMQKKFSPLYLNG